MKNYSKTAAAALLCAALTLAVGCRKHDDPIIIDDVPQYDFTAEEVNGAAAYYYGVWEEGPCNIFTLCLTTGSTRNTDEGFSGVGTALWLDINSEINASNILATGDYHPARGDSDFNAFLPGVSEGKELSGSYVYYRSKRGTGEYHLITGGNVNISYGSGTNPKYNIRAEVMADGHTYTFEYWGYLSYKDIVPQPVPGPDDSPYTHGIAEKWGQVYDLEGYNDYCNWIVYLGSADKDIDNAGNTPGRLLQLELNTAAGVTDITPGRYTIKEQDVSGKSLCAFSLLFANIDKNGNYWGTWYTDDYVQYGATDGYVDISKSGSNYTISYVLTDAESGGAEFSDSYTGPLEIIDNTETKASFDIRKPRTVGSAVRGAMMKKSISSEKIERRDMTAR